MNEIKEPTLKEIDIPQDMKHLEKQLDEKRKERAEQELYLMQENETLQGEILDIIPTIIGGKLIRIKVPDSADSLVMGVSTTMETSLQQQNIYVGDKVFIKRYSDRVGKASGRTYRDFEVMKL